jgi:hypothetical protein
MRTDRRITHLPVTVHGRDCVALATDALHSLLRRL